MTGEVRRAIAGADCLIGAERMLQHAAPGQRTCRAVAPEAIAQCIREHPDCRRFTVVLSGDSGFFSGARKLLPLLEDCRVEVLPGLSSMQVLCARLHASTAGTATSCRMFTRTAGSSPWWGARMV